MSFAWPVNENGRPVTIDAIQATVVAPCAKCAWMWRTPGSSSSASASATPISSSLAKSFRGGDQNVRRARTDCAKAKAPARASPSGRRRATRASAGRNADRFSQSQRTSVVCDKLVVCGRYVRGARMRSTRGCRRSSSAAFSTYANSVIRALEEADEPVGAPPEIELTLDEPAARRSEAPAPVPVGEQALERGCETLGVARGREDAGPAVLDRRPDRRDVAGDDRPLDGERLEHDVRQPVAVAGAVEHGRDDDD